MEVKKKIILLEDHLMIRTGIKELIEKIGPYKVSHEFSNGVEFIAAFDKIDSIDLIVLDLNMPAMNGERVIEKLNERKSKTPILVLTVNEDEKAIVKLFRLGVRGYLKKNSGFEELERALKEVFETGYFHNEFLTLTLQARVDAIKSEQELILEKLTNREKDFLKLICNDKEYTYEQIADLMHVQHRTIDGYRESIFDKFGIKSKTGLVLFILRYKLYDIFCNSSD
ncbi:MAG TPA: response regulator transcription factor [Bacteroidia bacterium]|jgi:two-component system invasion response regulator UvrY|nr:response regulator transcription factor [Bacteroidia bacterium]